MNNFNTRNQTTAWHFYIKLIRMKHDFPGISCYPYDLMTNFGLFHNLFLLTNPIGWLYFCTQNARDAKCQRTHLEIKVMIACLWVNGHDSFSSLFIFGVELEDDFRVVLGRVPMHVEGISRVGHGRPRQASTRWCSDQGTEMGNGPTAESQKWHSSELSRDPISN